ALSGGKPVRLSNEEDLRRVHALRARSDAVLVGIGTVLKDDPKLTVKAEYAKARNPLRIVLDSRGRTPEGANVLDRTAPTLIVTQARPKMRFECDWTGRLPSATASSWSMRWSDDETPVRSHAREPRSLVAVHGIRHRIPGAGTGSIPDIG